MNAENRLRDVFLYHSVGDSNLAIAVQRALEAGGLTTRIFGDSKAGKNLLDFVRNDLTDSRSYVFLCTPTAIDEQLLPFLYGAAWSQEKPIYSLRSDVRTSQLPAYLKSQPDFKLWSGIEKLIKTVHADVGPSASEPTGEPRRLKTKRKIPRLPARTAG